MTFDELSLLAIIWCVFSLLSAGLVKGILGIAMPLVAVPLLSQAIPVPTAVVLLVMPIVITNGWQAFAGGYFRETVRRFWPAFGTLFIGTIIGTRALVNIDPDGLLLLVGVMVIAFVLIQFAHPQMTISSRYERPLGLGFGFLSGVLGGVSSLFGPPMVMYMVSLRLKKDFFVGAIGTIYFWVAVWWLGSLIAFGAVAQRGLLISTAAAIPVLLGMFIGNRIRDRVSEELFRKIVLGVLLASGASLLWRAT